MKYIYTTLFLSLILQASAQTIDIGTTWTYEENHFFGFPLPPGDQRVSKITVVGDTILDGEQYFILDGGCSCGENVKYIREEGDQTYIYYDGIKHLLYDYSLEAGDVLSIAAPFFSEISGGEQDSIKLKIDSVSTVIYDGTERIVQYVDRFYLDESQYWSDWGRTFAQGLGSVDWCLFPQYGLCEGGTGALRCISFGDGTDIKLTSDYDCNVVSDYYKVGSRWTYRQYGSQDPDPIRTYMIDRIEYDEPTNEYYKILAEVDVNDTPIEATEIKIQTSEISGSCHTNTNELLSNGTSRHGTYSSDR